MKPPFEKLISLAAATALLLSGCQTGPSPAIAQTGGSLPKALAAESFLTDFAQNVAGNRLTVQTLVPLGIDPHEYEPAPQDLARLADSSVLIVNGAGFEPWLQKPLQSVGGSRAIVEASTGLQSRTPGAGEPAGQLTTGGINAGEHTITAGDVVDPHFWLDPNLAIRYVENIRDGLAKADPAGADTYRKNADAYIAQIKDLDGWIQTQVESIPVQRRLLVTNHESLGYFADRYGFKIVGTIIPSVSTDASPSAQQVAELVQTIRATGAPAIFLETGTNPQLADQIANETGVKVVTDLYTHSITPPEGPAPNYLAMMRHDTEAIVQALKG